MSLQVRIGEVPAFDKAYTPVMDRFVKYVFGKVNLPLERSAKLQRVCISISTRNSIKNVPPTYPEAELQNEVLSAFLQRRRRTDHLRWN